MVRKTAAALSAFVAIGIALVVGVPMASANEGGGQCTNYGDHNVIVAPFCGATVPSPTPAPTLPPVPTLPPYTPLPTVPGLPPVLGPTPPPVFCPQIYPPLPGCPGFPSPIGGGTIGGVAPQ